MKRPQGFDGAGPGKPASDAAAAGKKPARAVRASAKSPSTKSRTTKQAAARDTAATPAPAAVKPAAAPQAVDPVVEAKRSAKLAEKMAKIASRERAKAERAEVRRFTRRSRNRRLAWLSALAVVALLGGLIGVAVFSPLLSLEEIEVTGTSRVSVEEIHDAIDGQLGTPLALLDYDALQRQLEGFPLIRSYVTEVLPPHKLVVHVTEREPVGSIVSGGGFMLVDPAGVTIASSETRPEGVPVIDVADVDEAAFGASVEVLLALPDELLARVDSVTATTLDDVTLTLAGDRQTVVWGSAERSELKARVLERLVAIQDPNARIIYDVTAPLSAVVRPA